MTPTNISPEEFIKETKQWGATPNALIKVRMMKKGKFVYYRLTLPNSETIQTWIEEKDSVDWIAMNVSSVPAVWDDESEELKKINKKLEELNANTKTFPSDRDQDIRFR